MDSSDLELLIQLIRSLDGSLIEIRIDDAGLADWQAALQGLATVATSARFHDGDIESPFTAIDAAVFDPNPDQSFGATLVVGAQTWTTTFYSISQIDLQGDPREIRTETDLRNVCEVLELLHEATGKQVCLYPEDMRNESLPLICAPPNAPQLPHRLLG